MYAKSELAEAEFMFQYEVNAPASLGVTAQRLGGGVVLHMSNDPISYWSKALGFRSPITPELIDEILAFYRRCAAKSAVLQFAPYLLPESFSSQAARWDLVADGSFVKMGCTVDEVTPGKTDLRIGRVRPDDAAQWGEVILQGFGASPGTALAEMIARSVGNPAFQAFAAWDGDTMVAGGNLLVHGDTASINTGATLPGFRGRGAQSALIAARAAAAREAGCTWVFAETGRPATGESNTSLDNLRRTGLRVLYERRNWRWTAAAQATHDTMEE